METSKYRKTYDAVVDSIVDESGINRSRVRLYEAAGEKPVIFCTDLYKPFEYDSYRRQLLGKTDFVEYVAAQIAQRCLPRLFTDARNFRFIDYHPGPHSVNPLEVTFERPTATWIAYRDQQIPSYGKPQWDVLGREEVLPITGEEDWNSLMEVTVCYDGSLWISRLRFELDRYAIPYNVKHVPRDQGTVLINGELSGSAVTWAMWHRGIDREVD